jgi:uncharacterized membrane protein
MSNRRQPAKNPDNPNNIKVALERRALFSGPLPPPEVLKGYGSIDPQYPERIFKMAEEYARSDIKGKNTESFAIVLGMALSFLICISGLGACLFLALKGMTAESITAAITGFSPILLNALANLRKPQN